MKNGNVYSQLLGLLRTGSADPGGCLFGTITAVEPLTVRVGGGEVTRLFTPRGMTFTAGDVGREAALLSAPEGLVLLFLVEGGNDP